MKPKLFRIMPKIGLQMLQIEVQLNLLERAINASSNGIVITDAQQEDNPIIYVNQAFEKMTGYSFNEVVGYNCRFLQGNNRQQKPLTEVRKALQEGKECCTVLKNYRKDGSEFWNELYIAPVKDAQGHINNFIGIQTDITERKKAEDTLKANESKFRLSFELAPIGMALVGMDGRFLQVNQSLCETLGYTSEELMARSMLEISHPEDQNLGKLLFRRCLEGEITTFQLEKRYLRKDRSTIYTLVKATLVRDQDQIPLHYLVQILTLSCDLNSDYAPESHQGRFFAQQTTALTPTDQSFPHYLHYDGLTGLPSRIIFEKYLAEALKQREKQWAVFFLDLDRFQVVNESLGHNIGDQLLLAVSERLQETLQENDFIARSGGDEFAIFIGDINNLSEAIQKAKTLQEQLTHPFTLNTVEGKITTSDNFLSTTIGITLPTGNETKGSQVLQDAEMALGRGKKRGKASIEVFDHSLRQKVLRRSQIETDLKQAIAQEQLYLVYQPIINLATGQLSSFEALVRWQHPDLGFVSPGEFIPIAEETGLVIPIGYWVLSQACQQLQEWEQRFPEMSHLTMGVNLSALQIKDLGLVEKVKEVLHNTGLAGNKLKLELTETALIENVDLAREQLQQLKDQHGIQISVDDFGTGYASLSYLQRFPVDILKIDRSFVSAMTPESQDFKIVQGVISLAHALDMTVIGEGIETDYQRQQLQSLACEYGQGYFFAKPLGAIEATKFITVISSKR